MLIFLILFPSGYARCLDFQLKLQIILSDNISLSNHLELKIYKPNNI